jgi:hypothetical protein
LGEREYEAGAEAESGSVDSAKYQVTVDRLEGGGDGEGEGIAAE